VLTLVVAVQVFDNRLGRRPLALFHELHRPEVMDSVAPPCWPNEVNVSPSAGHHVDDLARLALDARQLLLLADPRPSGAVPAHRQAAGRSQDLD
jgi:hypothetical protein